MARVKDLWFNARSDSNGERVPTKRHGRGKRWLVEYRDPVGKLRTEAFNRKPDAERRLVDISADVQRGEYIDPRRGQTAFRELAKSWLEGEAVAPSSAASFRHKIERLNETFGDYPVGEILPSKCRQWRKARAELVAPGTLNLELWLLTAILDLAVEDDMIRKNPAAKLERLAKSYTFALWDLPTITRILDHVRANAPNYAPVGELAYGAGLRRSEGFGIGVDDIDFLRREVHVRQQLLRINGVGFVFAPPKRNSVGTVPVPQELLDRLAARLATFEPREVTLPYVGKGIKAGQTRTVRLLVAGRRGALARTESWTTAWNASLKANGITPSGHKTGVHILRHAYASYLIAMGLPMTVVQVRLRHARLAETYETYAHLTFEEQIEDAIARVFRSAPVPPRSVSATS
ncbi:tyrosine-type recombinase/integrase [Tenggerimyces flavus]|uniref:Tyrosine-type recombinase/integrase n=1 Tax=Tenggerimyces flavus TaxID=1708749 RepID=A0ABV7Y9R1_9ACTN|nr:tyrosine-type recombinase/integrase [Tenggerimyces flavus]MBM7788902.1 integrase [Tenggerimyces flavus]